MNPSIKQKILVTFILLVVANFMTLSEAYVYLIPDAKSPDQDGSCYDESLKIHVPVNEERQRPDKCESMSCGSDYALSVVGCGVIGVGPGMKLTKIDYSKPYPDCCPRIVMSSENLV